ncbi:MAG: hypothetical protein ACK42E_05705 [Candidatus Bipolaricaulaceae bacterium]
MILPIRGGRITASFLEPRPLSPSGAPSPHPTHIHGALDIAGGNGRCIAPVSGTARFLQFLRQTPGATFLSWDKPEILALAPRSYFYDTYGGILTIEDPLTGYYHILTHFWASSLWSRLTPHYLESAATTRDPCIALTSKPFPVREGEELLPVGNAGFSTGAHIHWEIHPASGPELRPHSERLDPQLLLKEQALEKRR